MNEHYSRTNMDGNDESKHHWHCTDVTAKKATSSTVHHEWGCTSDVQFETSTPSDVPLIVTALLNSKILGHVCLSCKIGTNTKDSVMNMFHNILPLLNVYDSASADRVDGIVQVTQVPKRGFRFDVTKDDDMTIYFYSSKVTTRVSSTSQKTPHGRLLEQIMGIEVSQVVNPAPAVTLSVGSTVNVRNNVTEEDSVELKEIQWWNVKYPSKAHKSTTLPKNLKDKVVSEFNQYMMSMHFVTPHGEELSKNVYLGYHEEFGALGIPLRKSWMETIKTALKEAASGFFPSPSCIFNVYVSEVKMTKDDVMTVPSTGKDKELILLTHCACLKVRKEKLAGLFVAVKVRNKTGTMPETSMKVAVGCKTGVFVKKKDNSSCTFNVGKNSHDVKCEFENLNNVDIMDHYVINIRSAPTSAKPSSSVLLRKDLFALCIYDASSVFSLSPFASWAWLSYRFQSSQLLQYLHHQDLCVQVTIGKHPEPNNMLPALVSSIRPHSDDIGCVDLHMLFCCDASDAKHLLQDQDAFFFLVDTDSNRLRELFTFLCTQRVCKVTIAGVFFVPSGELATLLHLPAVKPAPFLDARSPSAQKLIRDYLEEGKSPMTLWNKGSNVFVEGTIPRSDVIKLEQSIFSNATKSGALMIKYALSLVPKSGTKSSLLQLVMRCNGMSRVYATYCSTDEVVERATEACGQNDRVLLVLSDVSTHSDGKLRRAIQKLGELKKRYTCAVVVFYTIRASLFHSKLPVDIGKIFVFRFTTDADETRALIAKYSAYFSNFVSGLKKLDQDFLGKPMLITSPALVLHNSDPSDFAKDHASQAVSFALQSLTEYDLDGEYHKKYLLHLSILTAMTDTRQVNLGKVSFRHVRWQFLITDPTGFKHNLTSRLWIPVLLHLLAPDLQTRVQTKTYELTFDNTEQFACVMTEALISVLKTGSSLRPWICKRNGQIPVWLQNTKTHAGTCLEKLCTIVKKEIEKCRSSEQLTRLLIQLHILKVDVVRPKQNSGPTAWAPAMAALEELLQLNDTYYLSLHYHGNTLLTAITSCKHDSAFVSRHRSGAIKSFSTCLESKKSKGKTDDTERMCSRLISVYRNLRQLSVQCNDITILMQDIENLLSKYQTQESTEILSPTITDSGQPQFPSITLEDRNFSDCVFNEPEDTCGAMPVPAYTDLQDELQWFLPK